MNPNKKQEAQLWKLLPDGRVQCELCSHFCVISEGKKGICKERQNNGGVLYSLNYGRLIAAHIDPIEKKPLYHFLPGSQSFSIAMPGCNFRCSWCQNWDISQANDSNEISAFWHVSRLPAAFTAFDITKFHVKLY